MTPAEIVALACAFGFAGFLVALILGWALTEEEARHFDDWRHEQDER